MNNDKDLITTRRATLYQHEKLANQIQFLFPQTCGLVDISNCIIVLKYIDIGNIAHSEILAKDSELYKNSKIRCVLPVDSKLNQFAGNVSVRIVFMNINQETLELEQVMRSGNTIITIEPTDVIEESTDNIEKIALLEAQLKAVKESQIDDLILTDDLLQVSSSNIPQGKGVKILIPGIDDGDIDGESNGVLELDAIDVTPLPPSDEDIKEDEDEIKFIEL